LPYVQGYTVADVQLKLSEGGRPPANQVPPATSAVRATAEMERDLVAAVAADRRVGQSG
jgi:hypothetical protein